jgi:hypothetical protein
MAVYNQWQCLEWLKINGNGNIIYITDAANPVIYLWLSYSLWELTVYVSGM